MDNQQNDDRKSQGAAGAIFPLAFGGVGEQLRITRVMGGKGMAERLVSMGIQLGDTVQVVQNQGGALLVETPCGGRFVVGGGMADKIFVTRG